MKTKRAASTLISVLGAAVAFGALSLATPAEAGNGRGKARGHHKKVVVHHYPAPVYRAPVVVRHVVRPAPVVVRTYRPWYYDMNRVYVNASPYYFNAGLNVFLGGANLNLAFSNYAPAGHVYVDPYCGGEFYSVSAYRQHCSHSGHRAALQVVYTGDRDAYDYDDDYYEDDYED